jgi:hypothetical protein
MERLVWMALQQAVKKLKRYLQNAFSGTCFDSPASSENSASTVLHHPRDFLSAIHPSDSGDSGGANL